MKQAYALNFIKITAIDKKYLLISFHFLLLLLMALGLNVEKIKAQSTGVSTSYYYSKATGDLNELSTWGTGIDGSGTSPVSFTNNNQVFQIGNRATATVNGNWAISMTGSRIIVGSGVDFSIPASYAVTGVVDVNKDGKLTLFNTSLPTMGNLAKGSTVEYAQSVTTNILNRSSASDADSDPLNYSNLKLSGTGAKVFPHDTTRIGNLEYDGVSNGTLTVTGATSFPYSTIDISGDLNYLGTVNTGNAINLISTGKGIQTISGNGNAVMFSGLSVSGTAPGSNLVLSSANGGTNITLGDINGGGMYITPGNSIVLNGNNLIFSNKGTIDGTGTITGSPTSSIVINKTDAASFGSLYFSKNAGILNDLTINHSGTASADAKLGSSLEVVGTLNIAAGALSIGANTLTVSGPIAGNGTITGSASSSLVVGGSNQGQVLKFTQTGANTRSLANLSLRNGSSASLGSPLDVYGSINLSSATFHLNDMHLTLKSNTDNTARIGDLTGSTLDGATNVTMERWIKLRDGGTGRAYRLLTPTVNTATSIKENWMEGQMNTVIGNNVNNIPGYGTQISGPGGNVNGFDVTQSNDPSLYYTSNGTTPGYTAAPTSSDPLNAKTGYFMYIRGDRSMSMQIPLGPGMPTSSTTLRATGTILQGTQTSFTNPFDAEAGSMNLVTNPYPSSINWTSVYNNSSNISDYYTIWDANYGWRGGFVTVSSSGIASSGAANQFIQSGQAFFVQSTGGVPSLNIHESDKVDINNNNVFRQPAPATESFATALYFRDADGSRNLADGVIAVYGNEYSAKVDRYDATEVSNWDENIAINRNGKHLAIESRPVISSEDDLPLYISNMRQRTYEFEFTPSAFSNSSLEARLIDHLTGTQTLLSVTEKTIVPFSVNADPRSSAPDRFMVQFGPNKAAITSSSFAAIDPAITVYPNPVDGDGFNLQLKGIDKGRYNISLVNTMGEVVFHTSFQHWGGDGTQRIVVGNGFRKGSYQVLMTGENNSRFSSRLIKN